MNPIIEAVKRREACLQNLSLRGTDLVRLFYGNQEGIPGVTIDAYGSVVVVQVYPEFTEKIDHALKSMLSPLVETLGFSCVYLKHFPKDRSQNIAEEALFSPTPVCGTPCDEKFVVYENGVKYWIRPYDGYATGIFLDQRDFRYQILRDSQGKKILNAFSYTCGFSVAAAKAGAKTVSVDLSRRYLEWGRENFVLNELEFSGHRFIQEDVLLYFQKLAKRNEAFDCVILDPPSFSRGKRGVFNVEKDLERLLGMAASVVAAGGSIYFSSNYAGWKSGEYHYRCSRFFESLGDFQLMELPPLSPDIDGFSNGNYPLARVLFRRK